MLERISIKTYLENYSNIPIVDVRSPGEFLKGHIPSAYNIALFTDEERAQVGTVYKQQSKEKAIELGYTFVNPKLEYFISESKNIAPKNSIAIHCWRGGMRSQAFAEHLNENGFEKVFVIEKGYKAFRNEVLTFFEQKFNLKILGGYTGSGKTDILTNLNQQGHQVIDLEGLANHKGSAFGGIGLHRQPTVEQFENNLFHLLLNLNLQNPIWVEDESMNIGKVFIPKAFFVQMRQNRVYFIDIPRGERAKYLVKSYGIQNKEKLEEAILKVSKRLGPLNTKLAIEALNQNNFLKVAEISLIYYDKSYLIGLEKRDASLITKIEMEVVNAETNTKKLLNYVS